MRYTILILISATSILSNINAQEVIHPWEFKINAGYNIGGTSPLPMPVEVRKIEKYSPPLFAPHVAFEATRRFNNKWGLTAGLSFDYKGFSVKDSVLNLHTEIKMNDKTYIGTFTGHNETKIKNSYMTIPVMASYHISDKWLVQAGVYAAYLYSSGFSGTASNGYIREGDPTGDKTEVNEASFDFSDELNKFDFGLQAAGERGFSKRFAIRGQLAWGLTPVFHSDFTGVPFKMYNVYGTVGVSYKL
ncbi:MAG: PorT family protein [Candidatus Azobacteroides sp.]|nr:PorT family protein [Candidatus Azobacteroides sp.]